MEELKSALEIQERIQSLEKQFEEVSKNEGEEFVKMASRILVQIDTLKWVLGE